MKMEALTYKSYCCTMGTTSFRTSELNRKIELQLSHLDEFWSLSKYKDETWHRNDPLNAEFYWFLKSKGFVDGEAERPEKDAREKTSGLVELGLIDDERRLTPAGLEILSISRASNFTSDGNIFDLSRDSYRYLLQLLKASKKVADVGFVRPFVVLLRVLLSIVNDSKKRRYLTSDEFGSLLPLCVDEQTTDIVIDKINASRKSGVRVDVDEVVAQIVLGKDNYKAGLSVFLDAEEVTEELICDVGINRKSRKYDKVYYPVYKTLHEMVFTVIDNAKVSAFVEAIRNLNGNIPKLWIRYFFDIQRGERISKTPFKQLKKTVQILKAKTEREFRGEFYKLLQLFKAKSTLVDYEDLNRRYFSLSDCVVFRDGEVYLDDLPRVLFEQFLHWINITAYTECKEPGEVVSLDCILGGSVPTREKLIAQTTGLSEKDVIALGGFKKVMHDRRYSKFIEFLHCRFPKETVLALLRKFEDRTNDDEIKKAITDEADVPTMFEYIVGLAWYYLSGEKGDVLEYLNLSLGTDFLPKSHACGGEADIVWRYDANPPTYDKHVLLVEVTLTEKDNQRRAEMEPVSRHLGDYLIEHPDELTSYCAFVTTNLNPNVIADFRSKRYQIYYNPANTCEKVFGMKIIPLDTKVLCRMLEDGMTYAQVYDVFESNYNKTDEPLVWYNNLVSEISH